MNFSLLLILQLRRLIDETLQVATDNNLFEGKLTAVGNGIIQLQAEAGEYEQETRTVLIQLSAINFVREL
ncbi:putative thioredoxin/glutaredoxin [Geobacillus thermodenitrificans]|uniref:hypothetical protein n=1 Tax=Geobacillus thermodenitrificans TaxID=33940 RepID=UPI002E0907FA|nr:putative thioredoxin/glutaredoxin [Geobacillus thermodenitrificans]